MELDVHIDREADRPWGFTLVGGNDSEIPLTVIKVLPDSPADRAGLQNGDTILRIDGIQATDMSHAVASKTVNAAEDTLLLGVVRGLYDPVLDDFEPIYEPIDQDDLDQLSEPTEVPFKVAEFIDVPPPLDNRSLTASPFLQPIKPYRPFSTEPTDVPPLEDPIILNPEYKDNFPQREVEDILQIKPDLPPQSRFKLPISEQYDPDGKKIKKLLQDRGYETAVEFKAAEEIREEKKESTVKQHEDKEMLQKQEAQFMETMKKEIDLEKIEMTAADLVEESIQKATSVAQQIKSEVDVEIKSHESVEKTDLKSEVKKTKVEKEAKSEILQEVQKTKLEVKEDAKVVSELVELMDKTTDEIIKQSEVKELKKEVKNIEGIIQENAVVEERMVSTTEKIEESVESGKLRQKSTTYDTNDIVAEEKMEVERKQLGETKIKSKKQSQAEEQYQQQTKVETEKQKNGTKMSTSRLLAEQRAYTIGLQTIPNIRGSTHSSYHYNLLLKSFFIHLTDVMVALSRFILTEPVLSDEKETMIQDQVKVSKTMKKDKSMDVSQIKDIEQKEVVKKEEVFYEKKAEAKGETELKASKIEKQVIQDQNETQKLKERIEKVEDKEIAQHKKVEQKIVTGEVKDEMYMQGRQEWKEEKEMLNEEYDEDYYDDEEFIEIRRKTGAEMAQMAERKSADLIEKLDAVITEFQTKAGIEETDKNITVQRRTRSRSRSKVQERSMRESEPVETSSKFEKQSREITEMQTMQSSQSYEAKRVESRQETRQLKTPVPQTEDGKIMYVAIVESHVYTNPDAILEESIETTTTSETMNASRSEHVEMESSVRKEQVAQTVIQKAQEIQQKTVEVEVIQKAQEIEQKTVEVIQPIQIVEDIKSVHKHQASTVIEMSTTDIAESSEVSIEEVKDEVLKVEEPPVKALEVIYEASAKSVAESTEAYVEEVKTESLEITQPKTLQAKEIVETVAKTVAEACEVSIEEVKHEEFKVEETITTQAAETVVEDKVTAIAESSSIPVERGKTYDEASAELKIVKLVPKEVEEPVIVISEVELALQKRDVADAKIYESIVGVETAVQENRESLDISQIASFKSVGETKLDKTINIDEIEEVPVQVIEKTEVSIEGLNESDTALYQDALVQQSSDESFEAKAVILNTQIEDRSMQESHIEQTTEIKEASVKATSKVEESLEAQSVYCETKSVKEEAIESQSISEVAFEAKSVSSQKHVEKSIEEMFESLVNEVTHKTSVESAQTLSQQQTAQATVQETNSVEVKEESSAKPVTNGTDLPSPPTPETPVTDEYVFKLEIPLPKSRGTTPVPRDCTPPDDEDPHIVKKKLVPHIDMTIESYIFEPPLPTPPAGRELGSPEFRKPGLQGGSNRLKNMRYIKPGLRGGSDRPEMTKEEIMEIERTSSLLASAIDETLKSIEEYKEEVGIEAKKETKISSKTVTSSKVEHKTISSKIQSNGTAIKESKDSYEKEWKEIENQVKSNHKDVNGLSINVTIEETNVHDQNGKTDNDDKVQVIEVEVNAQHNGNSQNGFDKTVETKTENGFKNNINGDITKTIKESNSEVLSNGSVNVTFNIKQDTAKYNGSSTLNGISTEAAKNTQHNKDDSVKENNTSQKQNGVHKVVRIEEPKEDPMQLYRPVKFDPEEIARMKQMNSVPVIQEPIQNQDSKPKVYMTDTGEIIGSHQGIVDGLEEAVVDTEVAKALGKPGLPDEKIAELISGEAEMLREAHVMGLARVLSVHMHREDDSSVDFQKIKPVIDSLKNSEVLKALNEEMLRVKEQKKKEEKKWTTFLQKPKRPVPRPKFGYHGYVEEEQEEDETPYKVKIVKQPKPRVAPDYKPKDFDTGPLPWELSQQQLGSGPPPVEPEEPILIPEEAPEFLEAVDPLPESEVPDLEDTGIPLPPPPQQRIQVESPTAEEPEDIQEEQELDEGVVEEPEQIEEDMEGDRLAQELLQNVQKMVDPNATLEQQLAQMRAQVAALAQLPCVIQQTLDLVARQISQLSHQETRTAQCQPQENEEDVPTTNVCLPLPAARKVSAFHIILNEDQEGSTEDQQDQAPTIVEPEDEPRREAEVVEERTPALSQEELERRRQQGAEMMAEQQKIEKQRKIEHWNKIWPWGDTKNPHCRKYRINFMKYEKPPVSLDHLQNSEVYKVVHNLDETPLKRVETRTPVISEADYRERCRSISPYPNEKHVSIPQQLQP